MNRRNIQFGLGLLAALAFAFYLYRIFWLTPEDAKQGIVQKIFYIHAPSAMAMYLAFAVGLVCGLLYLIRGAARLDCAAAASMEVGLVFCTAVLLTGPVWAKAAWNTWWTWDPRLTLTLFTWFIFLSYFASRSFFGTGIRGRLFSSIFLLFGAVTVPLIHFSVRLWRGIHPNVVQQKGGLGPAMRETFLQGIFTMALLYLAYFVIVYFQRSAAQKGREAK